MGRRPNLFIVGAPKCGTTALYEYLRRHPEVFMSERKEPCFLASDFESPEYPESEEEYLALFAGADREKWVGEATTTYLLSQRAAAEIKRFSPEAKIIIMLRRPSDLIHSLHSQRLLEGSEDIADLEEALAAEPDRRAGRRLPRGLIYPKEYLLYREFARFTPQVQRFFDAFGRGRVHVIFYDNFRADPAGQFKNVCDFLGVSREEPVGSGVVRPNTNVRNLAINRVLRRPPGLLRFLGRMVPARVRRWLTARVDSLNWVVEARPPMSPRLRRDLDREFAPEIEALSAQLGRDLSDWTAGV